MMRVGGLILAVAWLAGCQRQPETFAPPVQRQPLEEFRPYRSARVVQMNDGDAEAFFVQDVTGGKAETSWRWAGKKPTLRFHPRSIEGLSYFIDFTLPEVTFKKTGPVTITFTVNGLKLDAIRYTEPGPRQYRKLIPPGWIYAGQPVALAAEIDKTWYSEVDGAALGFIVSSFGLEHAAESVKP